MWRWRECRWNVKNVEVEVCGMRWTDLGGGGHLLELLDKGAEAGTFLWLH